MAQEHWAQSCPICQGNGTCGTRIRQLSFSAIFSNPLSIHTETPKEDLEFTDMVAQELIFFKFNQG